jgi:hypothetical protein
MCPNSTWICLRASPSGLSLQEHLTAYSQLENFCPADKKSPQLIALIGVKAKTHFMKTLRLGGRQQGSITGEVRLRVDHDAFKEESPRIFVDCELHNISTITSVKPEDARVDIITRAITWHTNSNISPALVGHLVYLRLIAPFSTTVVFFADDFGGLHEIAEILIELLMRFKHQSSDLPASTHPQVLIFTQSIDPDFDEVEATKNFKMDLRKQADKKHTTLEECHRKMKKEEFEQLISAQFGGICVVAFPALNMACNQWQKIKDRILKESNKIQEKRQENFVAFSAWHLKSFFHLASEHFCSNVVSPFSFLQASRIHNPIPAEFQSHMAAFLRTVKSDMIVDFAVPVIASALVFDSYPSGMHGMLLFSPLAINILI